MRCKVKLDQFVPEVRLFHDRGKARRYLRALDVDAEFGDLPDAHTVFLDGGGDLKAVVLFEADADWHAEAALLAHEAVHVVMDTIDRCGFTYDQEIVAYMVQAVSESLFRAHEKWKRKHMRGR